jgi:hypothetical protein
MNHSIIFVIQLCICAFNVALAVTCGLNAMNAIAIVLSAGFAFFSLVQISKEK